MVRRIGERLGTAGLDVDIRDLADTVDPVGYDVFVIGSGVYAGHWLKPARTFVEGNTAYLATKQVWMFSSGPLGDPSKPDEDAAVDISSLMDAIQPTEHKLLAGAIDKQKLGFGERAIVRAVRAADGDYRDWDDIDAWTDNIAAALAR